MKDPSLLEGPCPFLDGNDDLCCDNDSASLMQANYDALDGVFLNDCSICAVNLKRMWCEYACNPEKAGFVEFTGYDYDDEGNPTYAYITITENEDYACDIFKSCENEAFIALSDITSSIQFMDFLGYNGKEQSRSVITFKLNEDPAALDGEAYPCETDIPEDGVFDGYQSNTNSTCAFCSGRCVAPDVNDNIGFLDGFNWHLVGWSYFCFIIFTIVYQVLACVCKQKMPENNSSNSELNANGPSDSSVIRNGNVNATIETSRVYSEHDNASTVLQSRNGKSGGGYSEIPSGNKVE